MLPAFAPFARWALIRPPSPPVIASVSPAFGSTAGDAIPRVISGAHLTGASSVTVGGSACSFSVTSDSQIAIASMPAKTAGPYDLAVTTPAGSAALANAYRAIASMTGYFDASIASTITVDGSNNIASISDLSPSGHTRTQSNGANKPLYVASSTNGLPAIRYNGTSSYLSSAYAAGAFVSVSGHTVFAVYAPITVAHNAGSYLNASLMSEDNGNFSLELRSVNGGSLGHTIYSGGFKSLLVGSTTGSAHAAVARHSGGNLYLSVDGGVESSTACGNAVYVGSTTLFGTNYNHTVFDAYDESFLCVFNAALSADEITSVKAYMTEKWGKP